MKVSTISSRLKWVILALFLLPTFLIVYGINEIARTPSKPEVTETQGQLTISTPLEVEEIKKPAETNAEDSGASSLISRLFCLVIIAKQVYSKAHYQAGHTSSELQKAEGLTVRKILNRSNNNSSDEIFDIIISNDSPNQFLLCEFNIQWQYYKGRLCSIASGVPLRPVADYIIELPVDAGDPSKKKKTQLLDPVIAIPPSNEDGPSLTTIRLQVHYFLNGRLDYHPCSDWDIYYGISFITDLNTELEIFKNKSWNRDYRE